MANRNEFIEVKMGRLQLALLTNRSENTTVSLFERAET